MQRVEVVSVTDIPVRAGGHCRVIVLQRPEKLNCLNLEMLEGLLLALQGSTAGMVVVGAAGRAFCTGLDLEEIRGSAGARPHLERLVNVYRWFLTTRVRTLALVRGYAAGGGAGLMACCGTVVVSEETRIRIPGGELASLASVVVPVLQYKTQGRAPAEGWLGCDLDTGSALRLGLVDKVVAKEEAEGLLQKIGDGELWPEWTRPMRRDPDGRMRAMEGLDRFLRNFGVACSTFGRASGNGAP